MPPKKSGAAEFIGSHFLGMKAVRAKERLENLNSNGYTLGDLGTSNLTKQREKCPKATVN